MNKSSFLLCTMGFASAMTLAACGGGSSYSPPENRPPMITGGGAVTVDEDTVVPLSFTVSDSETPADGLTVLSAISSDTTIVPTANIVVSGTGGTRVVTITPLPDAVGMTTITVAIRDGGGFTASASVPVTFREVRLDFPAYSRQAFAVPANGAALTITREKFNFTGDNDNAFVTYSDLIGP